MDYTAGRGTTALGIIGTALGGLAVAGNGMLGNVLGTPAPANCMHGCSEDHVINRYEAGLQNRISTLEGEKKLLESTIYTDGKSLEMYKYIDSELKDIRGELCNQRIHNQRTEDSFALARADLAAVKAELSGQIAMEAERRCCADSSIVNYVNATFYPKLVSDVTAGTTTTAQTLFNPIPKCGCCNGGNT